jgi:hypothetical protein
MINGRDAEAAASYDAIVAGEARIRRPAAG